MQATIERDGYVIARNLLSRPDLARLRAALLDHFSRQWHWEGLGKHQPNAASEIPTIGWIFAHPPIVEVFRKLTGSSQPMFTANCDAHMNMLSWWHKDTSEGRGGCFKGDYFDRKDLRVYRAGIYMQDHDGDGHGLHVRPGSQHTRSVNEGRAETLLTRAGDVVFFDPRLSHAGQLLDPLEHALLRAGQRLRVPALAYHAKESWRRLVGKQAKLSLFFTYGAPNQDTDDYCAFEMNARRRSGRTSTLTLSPQLLDALAAQQVSCNPWLSATEPGSPVTTRPAAA